MIRLVRNIEATSEAALLHDLRKRAKTLRYLIEFYRSVLEDCDTAGLVSRLSDFKTIGLTSKTSISKRCVWLTEPLT